MKSTHALAAGAALALGSTLLTIGIAPAGAASATAAAHRATPPPKQATMVGTGGGISTVDADASRIGLQVLRQGGNAVDAAVAAAAALGVTEPFSSGIGGGGFFVYYDHRTGKVRTIDGRETAPHAMSHDAFIDPSTGQPYPFTPQRVTSGVSVGTPGSLATWQRALHRWGTRSMARSLRPAAALARRGFVVDRTFNQQVSDNAERFQAFTSTRRLYLRGGHAPTVGSRLRNPDLAATYDLIARKGVRAFYRGALAQQIARTVQRPPKTAGTDLPVMPGSMTRRDLARYRVVDRRPTHVTYRGRDVYGMGPASSGGSTVGEALNILSNYHLSAMSAPAALHHYLEASALAYADRNAYVGDPDKVHVPLADLLSPTYAKERACALSPTTAMAKPVAAGDVSSYDGVCSGAPATGAAREDTENRETTNLTVSDRWGNVVEYTLTIEQTGGSGIVVPHRGFLLNNELTDFSAVYDPHDPNRIEPDKRPRSSISPTIVLRHGKPWLAVGSPGGATIITTVLQILFDRIDRGMTLPQAIAAPRASNQNSATTTAEQAFIDRYGAALAAYGQKFAPPGAPGTSAAEIGAATGIEFGPGRRITVAAEPTRRGGGSARVVRAG
ncbi:gamma-glutamyltransferase [Nocardioides nematodiphilus]|uniref:gamma-glutamyltransferase n=1 Tax=Nocardioides nematodiphilus TaxID=2849669 RepID=UPI001CD95915|nr:gamma-glutamyltransferase [Nocardioides nematodiphilus]MCA1983150.1 gamma-glutamyltransferase [Nocardioides nematodiphilus]